MDETRRAALLEAAEADFTRSVARRVVARDPRARLLELGTAVAFASASDSPFDKIVGLGFAPFDRAALLRFEDHERRHGRPLRVELSSLADAALVGELLDRGYRPAGHEDVACLALDRAGAAAPFSPGVEVRRAGADELHTWVEVVTAGFTSPIDPAPSADAVTSPQEATLRAAFLDMCATPGFTPYLARVDGVAAGGAGLRIDGTVAQLVATSTLPDFRGRGVQSALLQRRLLDASHAQCTLSTVTTDAGSTSQRNVLRAGFVLVYTRDVYLDDRGQA